MSGERPDPPRVDLHAHSHFSDGEDTPEVLAQRGRDAGLVAFALTDHDCLDGFPAFREAAGDMEAIPGVEISSRHQDSDVHVLGLFVDPGDPVLRERLATLALHRRDRTAEMVRRLNRHGVAITLQDVQAHSGQGTLGRPHVARALVASGAASSVQDAFRRYLRPDGPGHVPKPGPTPPEAVTWAREAGGVAVLAHPGTLRDAGVIEILHEAGLDGIEVWHPVHDPRARRRFLELAARLDLVPSGGSDYHGPAVGDARVGQEPVSVAFLERLRERRA